MADFASGLAVQVQPLFGASIASKTGGASVPVESRHSMRLFASPRFFYQKVYDNTLNDWVFYEKSYIDTNPLSQETTPNHSGNIDVASHCIVAIRYR